MTQKMQTRAPAAQVWEMWEKAHAEGGGKIYNGAEGKKGKVPYKIINVMEGKSFSILWKSLFVRLIFHHKVEPAPKGSIIHYSYEIRGPLAWLLRPILGKKIERNLSLVLKQWVN